MIDRSTPLALWRPAEEGEQSWGTLRLLFGGTVAVATASRADLLAALLDKEWVCVNDAGMRIAGGSYTPTDRCTDDAPHKLTGCHWAVKP